MSKNKDEITIRFAAAEYLTYVASVGDRQDSVIQDKTFIFDYDKFLLELEKSVKK